MLKNKKIRLIIIIIILAFLLLLARNIYINRQEAKALKAFNLEEYQSSIDYYNSILKLNRNPQYKINMAYNHYLLEEYNEAHQILLEVNESLNKLDDLYLLALTNEKLENHKDALDVLRKIVESDGNYAKAWGKIGYIENKQDNFNEAEEAYQKALKLRPRAGEYYLALAQLYYEQNQFEEEIRVYLEMIDKEAVVYNKTKEESLFIAEYNLGVSLFSIDKIEEATKYFESAVGRNTKYADAWYYLASSYALLGQESQMYDSLEKSIEYNNEYSRRVQKDNDFRSFIETNKFKSFIKSFE